MKMNTRSVLLYASLTAVPGLSLIGLSLTGCSNGPATPKEQMQANKTLQGLNAGNFSNTIFLGDSLTAGFQSDSLLDTTQVHGWAPVLAAQAGFNIIQPLIAYPGAPNVLQLISISPLVISPVPPPFTTGRYNFATQPTDLAVPGALVNDVMNTVPLANPTTPQEQITQLVLGFPGLGYGQAYSQATFAVKAQPTTIFLWIGNNDALVADQTGMPSSMTSVANFTTQYQALITQLTTLTPGNLIIANIPDVTKVPYLTPAAEVLGEVSEETGVPTAVLSQVLGIVPGDYVNPTGTDEITPILTGQQKGPISDSGVLSASEVVAVQAQVTAFNQVIAAQAQAAHATLVDINALFNQLYATGLTINGYTGTAAFLGGFFALDGIHPTNTGYAQIANTFIDAMNAQIKTKIPEVALGPVAAADPYWPPNIMPVGVAASARPRIIPASAGKAVDAFMLRKR